MRDRFWRSLPRDTRRFQQGKRVKSKLEGVNVAFWFETPNGPQCNRVVYPLKSSIFWSIFLLRPFPVDQTVLALKIPPGGSTGRAVSVRICSMAALPVQRRLNYASEYLRAFSSGDDKLGCACLTQATGFKTALAYRIVYPACARRQSAIGMRLHAAMSPVCAFLSGRRDCPWRANPGRFPVDISRESLRTSECVILG